MTTRHSEAFFEGFPLSQWQIWLQECQDRFGQAPRSFDAATLRLLLVNPPWVTKLSFGNPLAKLVQNRTLRGLFQTGVVTWGHVIQANEELFSPAPDSNSYTYDRAGEVVFGVHGDKPQTPVDLQRVSEKLASLKYSCDLDSELEPWADYLAAETVRVVGWQVPSKLSAQSSCFVSTTLFRRSHLPTGVLQRPFFPLIVANRQPYFAMPLPKDYWPKELLQWWSQTSYLPRRRS